MDEWIRAFWDNLVARKSGPFGFRFVLQPLVAVALGLRDGLKDAREGRPAFAWSLLTRRHRRRELLAETWTAAGRVFLLALAMDIAYQFAALDAFRPLEALAVSVALAFVPYVVIRGPMNRLAKLAGTGRPPR